MTYEANRPVETSLQTFEIIEQMTRTDGIRLSELASELGVSKGIVHNHLSTLRELGYVRKRDNQYQLTAKLLSDGFRARSHSRLFTAAHDPLTAFAERFDTGGILAERAATDCIVIDAQRLPSTVNATVGTAVPVPESLLGLTVASYTGADSGIDSAPAYDPGVIAEDIDERGYTIGSITSETDVSCVAIPITDEAGDCYGSIGVLLPEEVSEQRSERIIEASEQLRTRIGNRLDSGWEATRSFATEKHSWIS